MKPLNTGRPAFPCVDGTKGLTKREYIAIKAMQAFLSNGTDVEFKRIAMGAFLMADTMIEEGEKRLTK